MSDNSLPADADKIPDEAFVAGAMRLFDGPCGSRVACDKCDKTIAPNDWARWLFAYEFAKCSDCDTVPDDLNHWHDHWDHNFGEIVTHVTC